MRPTPMLDFFFPPLCLGCRERVAAHGTFCSKCWQQLTFISDPICIRCGIPFDYTPGTLDQCGHCLHAPPPFSQARAVLRYDDASRALVLRLKYQDDTALAKIYGPWLVRAGEALLRGCDAIMPAPLHYGGLVGRRYDEAALLAQQIKRITRQTVWPHALRRIRATPAQTALSAKARAENVAGAFAVHARKRKQIRGKTVLLIDDVYTTGATLSACAVALLDAGAQEVRVLTLARRC